MLLELGVDLGCYSVMAALVAEDSAMAREFVFFCERSLDCSGTSELTYVRRRFFFS